MLILSPNLYACMGQLVHACMPFLWHRYDPYDYTLPLCHSSIEIHIKRPCQLHHTNMARHGLLHMV